MNCGTPTKYHLHDNFHPSMLNFYDYTVICHNPMGHGNSSESDTLEVNKVSVTATTSF